MKLAKVSLEAYFGKIQAPLNLLETDQSLVETGFEKIAEPRGYFCPEVLALPAHGKSEDARSLEPNGQNNHPKSNQQHATQSREPT